MKHEPDDTTQLAEEQLRPIEVCRVCGRGLEFDEEFCPRHPDADLIIDEIPLPSALLPAVAAQAFTAAPVELAVPTGKPRHIAARHGAAGAFVRRQNLMDTAVHGCASSRIRPWIQTFLPLLGGCMPQTAQPWQRAQWAACRLRQGLPVTPDMDPAAMPDAPDH